jgi:hypothetical protein
MRIHLIARGAALAALLGALGCGSYSAPNNQPGSSDSTRDSTMTQPPGYGGG